MAHPGILIRAEREAAGLSVRELASCVGIHPQSLRNIELGKRTGSPSVLESISAQLRLDVAQITHESGNPNPPLGRHAASETSDESAAPAFRLYTSAEGALRIGGGITASLLNRLATRGVEHTLIGGKVRWTDAQLANAVAVHATSGPTAPEPATVAASQPPHTGTRRSGTRRPRATRAATPPSDGLLTAQPGRRYSA